jgi:hypothetical protein
VQGFSAFAATRTTVAPTGQTQHSAADTKQTKPGMRVERIARSTDFSDS